MRIDENFKNQQGKNWKERTQEEQYIGRRKDSLNAFTKPKMTEEKGFYKEGSWEDQKKNC